MDVLVNLTDCFKNDAHSRHVKDMWERALILNNTYEEEERHFPMERWVPLYVDLHLSAEIYFRAYRNDDIWCPDDGQYNQTSISEDAEHSNMTREMAIESGIFTVLDRLDRSLSRYYYFLCDLEAE